MLRNHVQLIGRIGADPELKTFEGGNTLLNVSLATNDYYRDKDGNKQESTEWHRISVWGKNAENMEKLVKKGDEIAVEGKLVHRSYEKDGQTRYISEVKVNEFIVLQRVEDK